MRITGHENPKFEDLEHFGVLGMKWGRTRAKGNSTDVRSARARLVAKQHSIERQDDKVSLAKKGSPQAKTEQAKLDKLTNDFDKDPARVLASRLTRGEKATVLVIGAMTGVGIPIAAAAVAGTSLNSRRIEQQQAKGKFDKTKKK